MTCGQCCVELSDDATFCSYCGVQVRPFPDAAEDGGLSDGELSSRGSFEACMSKYTDFRGRACRTEFWRFLWICAVTLFLAIVFDSWVDSNWAEIVVCGLLVTPLLAVTARRLHDVNKSIWMLLLFCTSLVGPLGLLWQLAKRSDERMNRWGAPRTQGHSARASRVLEANAGFSVSRMEPQGAEDDPPSSTKPARNRRRRSSAKKVKSRPGKAFVAGALAGVAEDAAAAASSRAISETEDAVRSSMDDGVDASDVDID